MRATSPSTGRRKRSSDRRSLASPINATHAIPSKNPACLKNFGADETPCPGLHLFSVQVDEGYSRRHEDAISTC